MADPLKISTQKDKTDRAVRPRANTTKAGIAVQADTEAGGEAGAAAVEADVDNKALLTG